MLNSFTKKIISTTPLSEEECSQIVDILCSKEGVATAAQIAAFLVASRSHMEPSFISGIAAQLLRYSLPISKPEGLVIDIVGTGGDGKVKSIFQRLFDLNKRTRST